MLIRTLTRTILENQLIVPGDRVLLAVSGGQDSFSLLHALHVLRGELGLADLRCAHLDHGLRGEQSATDADFVASWCTEHGIECHTGLVNTAALAREQGVSIQQAARGARYAFLEAAADSVRATKIATGHTRDDQAETILLNIVRGSGIEGLRGIPMCRDRYIRPLLETSRAETAAYCRDNGLAVRQDSSNLDADHYTRNRIRLELLPSLEQDYNVGVRDALLRLSDIADRDADYLREAAESALDALLAPSAPTVLELDAKRLRALHPALLRHVLRAALSRLRLSGEGISYDHIESVCEAINRAGLSPFGITTPPPYCRIRVTQRWVKLTPGRGPADTA